MCRFKLECRQRSKMKYFLEFECQKIHGRYILPQLIHFLFQKFSFTIKKIESTQGQSMSKHPKNEKNDTHNF